MSPSSSTWLAMACSNSGYPAFSSTMPGNKSLIRLKNRGSSSSIWRNKQRYVGERNHDASAGNPMPMFLRGPYYYRLFLKVTVRKCPLGPFIQRLSSSHLHFATNDYYFVPKELYIISIQLLLTNLDKFMSLRTLMTMVFSPSSGLLLLAAPRVLNTERMFLRPKS